MAPQISPVDRQRIVGLWDAGHRIKEIEVLTGISRKSISFWIRRNEETGGDLSAHHRTLYTRATTAEQDAEMQASHAAQPFLNTQTTASQYNISTDTVRRRLKEAGLRHRRPARKIPLTEQHAQARVGFCLEQGL